MWQLLLLLYTVVVEPPTTTLAGIRSCRGSLELLTSYWSYSNVLNMFKQPTSSHCFKPCFKSTCAERIVLKHGLKQSMANTPERPNLFKQDFKQTRTKHTVP